jgi:hypothetical protein
MAKANSKPIMKEPAPTRYEVAEEFCESAFKKAEDALIWQKRLFSMAIALSEHLDGKNEQPPEDEIAYHLTTILREMLGSRIIDEVHDDIDCALVNMHNATHEAINEKQ